MFACGSNQFGQLASEKTKESNQFVPILHLEAEKVSEISSGLSHTLAMTGMLVSPCTQSLCFFFDTKYDHVFSRGT